MHGDPAVDDRAFPRNPLNVGCLPTGRAAALLRHGIVACLFGSAVFVVTGCEEDEAECEESTGRDHRYCGVCGGAYEPTHICAQGRWVPNWWPCTDPDDQDMDGFTNESCSCAACTEPPDCNDRRFDVHPGATEVCDGVDQDCDGETDEDTGYERCGNGLDDDCDGETDEWCS